MFLLKNKHSQLTRYWWTRGAISLTRPPLQTILKIFVYCGILALKIKPGAEVKIRYKMTKYLPPKYVRLLIKPR